MDTAAYKLRPVKVFHCCKPDWWLGQLSFSAERL